LLLLMIFDFDFADFGGFLFCGLISSGPQIPTN